MNTCKAVSAIIDKTPIITLPFDALRIQMVTRPMEEFKETIFRELLTSPKVQECVGKIINKLG